MAEEGNRMHARLRVRRANDEKVGFLSHPLSWEAAFPLNDIPSLTVNYHDNAPNFRLLNFPRDIILEIYDRETDTYREMPNCRFLNIKQSGELMAGEENRSGSWSFSMPGYGWMLKKVRNIKGPFTDGRKVFNNTTVGNILATMIDEAQEGPKPVVRYMLRNFSSTVDSSGNPWSVTDLDYSMDSGLDLYSTLEQFTASGLCDWRFDHRTLEVFNPDTTLARDFSGRVPGATPQEQVVVVRPFYDIIREPVEATREDMAAKMFVKGDNNTHRLVSDDDAEDEWGNWVETISAGGMTKDSDLDRVGEIALEARKGSGKPFGLRMQLTKELQIRTGSKFPMDQYRPGDFITGPAYEPLTGDDPYVSKLDKLRVQQITLSYAEPYGIRVNLVLNDRFAYRELRLERQLNRLAGQDS